MCDWKLPRSTWSTFCVVKQVLTFKSHLVKKKCKGIKWTHSKQSYNPKINRRNKSRHTNQTFIVNGLVGQNIIGTSDSFGWALSDNFYWNWYRPAPFSYELLQQNYENIDYQGISASCVRLRIEISDCICDVFVARNHTRPNRTSCGRQSSESLFEPGTGWCSECIAQMGLKLGALIFSFQNFDWS